MSVLYFGDPQGALALLDRGVTLGAVVHGRAGGPGRHALTPRVRHLPRWTTPDLNDPALVAALAATAPKLIVASFYPRRIPDPVLALAPGINVHPSDLPRWRGPDPCHWTLRAGDTRTALCVQWLHSEIDAGDILLREPVSVGPHESAGALAERLEARGAILNAEVAVRLLAGEAIESAPQTGEISWAPLADPDDLEIDWSRPAREVEDLVRASAPYPHAFTGIGDELLVIKAGRAVDAGPFAALDPGTPYVRRGQTFIRCGDGGSLRLDRVILGRTPMTGRAFGALLV